MYTTRLTNIIIFIYCIITYIKIWDLWIKLFTINWKIIINRFVIKTLWKLCPFPWKIIYHFKLTIIFSYHFNKSSLREVCLSINTWSINIIKIYSFKKLFISIIKKLTTCWLTICMASTFPVWIDFWINKMMSIHELNFTVF